VHKPPGVHCHPLRYSDQDTILNFLAQEKKWKGLDINAGSYDRGLLYRLDYETYGVLIIDKREGIFKKLREDFHSTMKRKLYWAVVDGSFEEEGEFIHHFRATGVKGSKQRVSDLPHPDSEEGTIRLRRIQELNGKTLL